MKSLLKTKWTLWEHRSKSPDDERWMDQFYDVAVVDTVEKLWLLLGHYPAPSSLFAGHKSGDPPPLLKRGERVSRVLGLCLFKDPVPPETRAVDSEGMAWTGLRSILDIDTSFEALPKYDKVWQRLLLTLVGEEYVASDKVNGIWLANRTRKNSVTSSTSSIRLRIELWWASSLHECQAEELKDALVKAVGHESLNTGWRIR